MGYWFDCFIFPSPFVIEVESKAEDHSVTAFCVLEVAHNLKASPQLSKATLDSIGGADGLMEFWGELKEVYEFVKVALQTGNCFGDSIFPAPLPHSEKLGCYTAAFGIHNPGRLFGAGLPIPSGTVLGHIPQLVHPA